MNSSCQSQFEQRLSYVDNKKIYEEQLFRIQSHQMSTIVHRSIAALSFTTNYKQPGGGSAVLLAKDLALTAAHNLFNKEQRQTNGKFKIYLGASGPAERYYQIQSYRYLRQFQTCKNKKRLQFDYALVKLAKPVQFEDFLEICIPCETCLINNNQQIKLQIYGYPVNGQNYQGLDIQGRRIQLYQYGLARKNRIVAIKPNECRIQYALSTQYGQSGSPIITDNQIIGIHNGSSVNKQLNIGRIITEDFIINLIKWSEELSSQRISINYNNLCFHLQSRLHKSKIPNIKQYLNINSSTNTIKMLQKIAKCYQKQKNYPMALTHYQQLLQIRQKQKKIDLQILPILKSIGKVYSKQKDYTMALKYYFQSIQIQTSLIGFKSSRSANTLNNIGLIYYAEKKYHQAHEVLQIALSIYGIQNQKQMIGKAETHNNIGIVYQKEGNYQKALEHYYLSLEIKNKVKGKESIDAASTLNNIGVLYKHQGNYIKAIDCYKQSIKICEVHQYKKGEYGQYFLNLGCAYFQLKQVEEAVQYAQYALKIFQQYRMDAKLQKTNKLLEKCKKVKEGLALSQLSKSLNRRGKS